jgi:6-methylsalicylate decarboxylase
MKTDIHQHLWTEPLVQALAQRTEFPFVRDEHGLTVLFLAGERPYVIDLASEAPARRAELVRGDGLHRALVCLSSPLGIESLPRAQALRLLDAYHEGALALGEPFGVWGALALEDPDPDDVDRALDRGCVGISLPAGALAGVQRLARLRPLLARLERRGAPLFVHPGLAGAAPGAGASSLGDPLWWPALTHYVADMHAAFLAFLGAGRAEHPELRVVFAMLAGLAPLHGERLAARGGPDRRRSSEPDPLVFYDTSSYGPLAIGALADAIGGPGQLLYGSDRPVVEPALLHEPDALDWELLADATARAFGAPAPGGVSQTQGRVSQARVQAPEAAIAAAQSPPNVPVAREEALR